MIVSVLGYMGSGKSTISKYLAQKLSMKYVDLDEYIILKEKSEIKDIFKEKGEIYFRKLERKYLEEVLEMDNIVLGLGGGSPVFYDNIKLINEKSESIYLRMSPKRLAERLFDQRSERPLILKFDNIEALKEFIAKHLFERNPFYNEAKYIFDNNEKKVEEIGKEILKLLKEKL